MVNHDKLIFIVQMGRISVSQNRIFVYNGMISKDDNAVRVVPIVAYWVSQLYRAPKIGVLVIAGKKDCNTKTLIAISGVWSIFPKNKVINGETIKRPKNIPAISNEKDIAFRDVLDRHIPIYNRDNGVAR